MVTFTTKKQAIEHCISSRSYSIVHLSDEDQDTDIQVHDYYEIYFSLSEGNQFLIDNNLYDVDRGDLFVINDFECHLPTKSDIPNEHILIMIHPNYINQLSSDATNLADCFTNREEGYSHRLHLTTAQQHQVQFYINKLLTCNCYGSDIIEKANIMELLVMINSIYCEKSTNEYTNVTHKHNQQVGQIIDYINQHICQSVTIENLAKHFYLSDSYICRIFKSVTGTTINKYITARRISIAKALLYSGYSVNEVYLKSGFNDYSNFLKAFTKVVGISPKKYALHCH